MTVAFVESLTVGSRFLHEPLSLRNSFTASTITFSGTSFAISTLPISRRQHEMYDALARFLIPLKQPDDVTATSLDLWQLAKTEHCVENSSRSVVIDPVRRSRDMRSRDHSPGNRFAMQKTPITRFSLERMPNGMSEIQHSSQPVLPLVGGDYLGLQPYRFRDHPFDCCSIAAQSLQLNFFEAVKQRRLSDHSAL